MARRAILAVVIVGIAAVVVWRAGLLGPVGSTADGPLLESEIPDLAEAGEATGSAMAPSTAALESGGKKPVAKSKAPTVDGPRITGKVTDRAGTGIPDARVVSSPDTSKEAFHLEQIGSEGCPGADAITDAEGKFVVAVSNDAPYHALVATAEGYGVAFELSVRAGSDVTLVLDRASSISGHVTDAEGTGIAGAKIIVHVLYDALTIDRAGTSGAGGAYRVDGLPPVARSSAPWRPGFASAVEVTAEGYAPLLATGIATLQPGKDVNRDFVLGRGASVVGKVVDADSGDPIEGARIVLWSQEGEMGYYARGSGVQIQAPWTPRALGETTSAKDGAFQFEHVPAQGFHPLLSMNYGRRGPVLGYVGAMKEGSCGAAEEVPFAKEGARTEVTLKLWPAAIIEGRVVDATGKPIEKATVEATSKERATFGWLPKKMFNDPTSAWNWEGVGADGKYRLTGVPVPRAGSTEVKVRGRFPQKSGNYQYKEEGDGSVTVTVAARTTVTAPDLILKPSDPNPQTQGQATLVETFVKVVSARGAPVWGANLTLNTGTQVSTDREGKGVISWMNPNLPQIGLPTLTVRAKGFATTTVPMGSATGTELLVTMQAPHRLAGRVVGPDGAAVARAYVSIGNGSLPFDEVFPERKARSINSAPLPAMSTARSSRSGNSTYAVATTDDQGQFVAEDLPEGPYHLTAVRFQAGAPSPGGKPAPRGVLVSVATDASDVAITMPPDPNPPTGALEGTVVDSSTGRPVPGLTVTLRRGDEVGGTAGYGPGGMAPNYGGSAVGQPSIPSPGRYEFPAAASGTWSIVASAEGYAPKTLEGVVVRANETSKAPVLRLDHGVTVKGHLVPPEGMSLADRILYFTDSAAESGKERWLSTTMSADGNYSLGGFTPGVWRLACLKQYSEGKAEPPLMPVRDERVQVRDGDSEVRFDVTLIPAGTISVQPQDERLPPPPWDAAQQATDAQKAFGDASRIVVKAADGTVIAEQKGKIQRGNAGKVGWVQAIPGRYTVRLEMPGDEVREETVDVASGGQATVTFVKK